MLSKLRSRVRNILVAGLLVTLPIAVTIYILVLLFRWVDGLLSPLLFRVLQFPRVPAIVWLREHNIPGLGVVVTVALIFFVGLFAKNIIGRRVVASTEELVARIPVARTIYVGAKQILEAVAMPGSKVFKQVVLVECPREGVYTLGFLTNEGSPEVEAKLHEELVHVFVPTVPNPTTGFLLLVPRKDVVPLNLTIEEGIRIIVSAGVLA